ncbi:MAG: helix-turn-helix transcriptional regulator [Clostridia bacterium]|nr:helix-turn-helix transcriptional regulator [Clostridia bacterium]
MQNCQRLKGLRKKFSKSQTQIAEVLQIKQPQYARYESGSQEIPLHYLIVLAYFYNVSLDYLTGLIDIPENLNRFSQKRS